MSGFGISQEHYDHEWRLNDYSKWLQIHQVLGECFSGNVIVRTYIKEFRSSSQ